MLRDVKIKSVLNGWIVEVGYQTLVFDDLELMAEELKKYLAHPKEMEKEYLEGSINSGKLGPVDDPIEIRATSGPITWSDLSNQVDQES